MTAAAEITPPPHPSPMDACVAFAPPPAVELPRFSRYELWDELRSGTTEADDLERGLAKAARIQGALSLAIGEGLAALRVGDRLAELGHHLGDYAREVLDLEPRTALNLAHLATELRTRPLLREALRAGVVRLRAAQTVLPVARGDAEAFWVRLAARETVRALEARVKAAAAAPTMADSDEVWGRLVVECTPEERATIDAALEVARQELPGARRCELWEAIAQEFLGEVPPPVEDAEESKDPRNAEGSPGSAESVGSPGSVGSALSRAGSFARVFRRARTAPDAEDLDARKARLEAETDRWAALPAIPDWHAPELRFEELTSAAEVDAALRELARFRRRWDELVGHLALMMKRSRLHQLLGFASFRHYVEERLGLPGSAVEQRAVLEEQIWESPALREARRQRLSYEKLRALARLPEKDIGSWVARAQKLSVIDLRHAVDAEGERQMRARGRVASPMPLRVAALLATALDMARDLAGGRISDGACLALVAQHFLDVWGEPKKPKTTSQKVRARESWRCAVPGCSHAAGHAHHVLFRSHGGAVADPANQIGLCAFHHLRCIHGGFLRVRGTAPDGLTWSLCGAPFPPAPA